MRVLDAAGALGLLSFKLEAIVSLPLFEVIVLTDEAPTADTPIAPAPGSRVTACFLVNNTDMELGTRGSGANLTFCVSPAAGYRAELRPIIEVVEFLLVTAPYVSRGRWTVNSLGTGISL